MRSIIKIELENHIKTAQDTLNSEHIILSIERAAKICIESLENENKILLFGNGGSASDAQHIAAELVGRYKDDRKGLAALALTTDTSALTAIGNDFGYSKIFERQIEALANKGDTVIGISTGGSSTNVLNGLLKAKNLGCKTIGFSGRSGGEMNEICDLNLVVPAEDTARIQEIHIIIGHTICQLIDNKFSI